jgi:DNA-binding MarR family transcriptional regulator
VARTRRDIAEREIMLGLLASIERNSAVTQRKIAGDLGIALGLANAYLRRCVRKGLVKVSQVPLNRYAYYLTPQGFVEKSRLTAEYLAVSFNFFRRARADCEALLAACADAGWRRVALFGAGELAEIAVLSNADLCLEIVAVIDARAAVRRCGGVPVVGDVAAAAAEAGQAPLDGVILTDTQAPQARFEELLMVARRHGLRADQVVAPSLLGILVAPAATEAAA